VYRIECRELAAKPGSEAEYRTHLNNDVIEKLARIPQWRRTLSASCSDKLWHASLKPPDPMPILALPPFAWPSLALNPMAPKPQDASHGSMQTLHDTDITRTQPNNTHSNFTLPPAFTELTSANSDPNPGIATPKPDITVGLARESFSRTHAALLEHWQTQNIILSDPHAI
jgi:hypothetical protein